MDAQMLRSRARDRAVREEEALSGDRSRPSRTDGGNGVRWPRVAPVSTPNPNAHPNPFGFGHHHPFPVMYPHQQVQYVPVPNGFGFPFVMPCWAPTISAVAGGLNRLERKVYQPLSGRGFPVQGTAAGPCDGDSSGSKGIEAAKDVNTSLNSDSSGSSSSAISDRRSGSFGGINFSPFFGFQLQLQKICCFAFLFSSISLIQSQIILQTRMKSLCKKSIYHPKSR